MMDEGGFPLPLGYVPHGEALDRPFDRRRFPRYAAMRGLPFDVVRGWEDHEVIVLSPAADVTYWVNAPSERQIVFDLPDAYLDEPRGFKRSVRGLAKWAGGESRRPVLSHFQAVGRLLERADAVVCSTAEQAANIGRYNNNVHPILDLLGELESLPPIVRPSNRLNIVWEGLTATLPAIRQVLPALRSLALRCELRLHLVTDLEAPHYMNRFVVRRTEDLVKDWGVDVELHSWSVKTLTEVASFSDIAIVPVDLNDPVAAGKPENRMRIFWRLGLPVVVSACPAHARAAKAAGLAERFVCTSAKDWESALGELWSRPDLRAEVALAGQAAGRSEYSEDGLAERWDQVLQSLNLGRP